MKAFVCPDIEVGVLSGRWTDRSVRHLPGTHTWGFASCQAGVAASPDPSLPVPEMGDAEILCTGRACPGVSWQGHSPRRGCFEVSRINMEH